MIGREGDYAVDEFGCWIWQRSNSGKYGRVQRNGEGGPEQTAHRWYYQQFIGPIPEGYQIDHLCRVPLCVNPEHLEAVTPAENVRRSSMTKLTVEDVRAIRWLGLQGFGPVAIASLFPVKPPCISNVLSGHRWADVPFPTRCGCSA